MPTNAQKSTAFQVSQPDIPGVPRTRAGAKKRRQIYMWAGGGAAGLILLVLMVWWVRAATRFTEPGPIAEEPSSLAPAASPAAAPKLPVAPGIVATTEELSRPWSTQRFTYGNKPGDSFAAMVVRLPGNAYWAFSLQAPYGTCELELLADLPQLRSTYKFSATHPMLADPCTHTLYDLTKYGSGPNGLVRGAVVAGTGIRPPLAIEVHVEGQEIIASQAEKQ
ncbi:MAG TPA: hypothetical protein VGU63_06250 [Candidatus Acidoferrales bacterium]|nr:hypothetical protein [Candidatus Acidoferrales bacterium]